MRLAGWGRRFWAFFDAAKWQSGRGRRMLGGTFPAGFGGASVKIGVAPWTMLEGVEMILMSPRGG
jgi:hypothetical protein